MNEGKILVVDDNADDVELTMRALRRNNICNPVDIARDGEEALALLHNSASVLPSLVLLDLNLPKVNGLEVLRRIRHNPRTRLMSVVVLTTSSEERDIVESYVHGANSYIRKPVVFSEFMEAVRVLGLYWLLVNEAAPAGPDS